MEMHTMAMDTCWRCTYVKGPLEKYPTRLLLNVKVVEVIPLEGGRQAVPDRTIVVGILV